MNITHVASLLAVIGAAAAQSCSPPGSGLPNGANSDAPLETSSTELFARTVTRWGTNIEPAAWSAADGRVIYNRLGTNNLWNAYSANPDGTAETCLTCVVPRFAGVGAATNRGATDITPDGKYVLLTVEKGSHPGTIGDSSTDPGRGVYNDLWLVTADGTQSWPLTNLPVSSSVGTIWQRFDRTGGSIVWAQMYQAGDLGHIYGYWKLEVADLVWSQGAPALVHARSFVSNTGEFYEPYGFSPDNQRILFASDMGQPGYWASKIWSIDRQLAMPPTRLTPTEATGFFADYDEFAFYAPGTDRILYGRTFDTSTGGMDFWTMAPDGSDERRLTFLNEPWNVQSAGYSVVGGLAFDPNNPNRMFVGVAQDQTYNNLTAYMVTLEPYGADAGLTGEYFSDLGLTTRVASRVDPAVEFRWNGPPSSALGGTNFSARWTGSLRADQTGTYQLCTVASGGTQLWLDGGRIVDDWFSNGATHCGTANLVAGAVTPLRMDYWNGFGVAVAYLSWVRPDGVRETVPPSALRP